MSTILRNAVIHQLENQPKEFEEFFRDNPNCNGDRFKREGYWFMMLNDTPYTQGSQCLAGWSSADDLKAARQ